MSKYAEFEQNVDVLETALTRHPLHRELLYKTLCLCRDKRSLDDLERKVSLLPEFSQATQSPYHLISVLVDAGGLLRTPVDASGHVVEACELEGLSEDEKDDLVASEELVLSDVGEYVVGLHDPAARMSELFEVSPERAEAYLEVLGFCSSEPRSYADIAALLNTHGPLYSRKTGEVMQPSVIVDGLQRAAALVWKDGWRTTEEGVLFLQERS